MIEKKYINDLIPNPNNPRTIEKKQLKKLIKSIKDFPEMLKLRPIVIDDDNVIIGGNMRYAALKEMGKDDVWVIKANNLTEEQKKEFVLKDNVSFGEWDWDILANDYTIEQLDDWALDVPEYLKDEKEEKEYEELEEDGFSETEDEVDVQVKEGDLIIFTKGDQTHKLYVGDATKQESWVRLMGEERGHLIYTDPPYGISYTGGQNPTARIWDMIENDELRDDELVELIKKSFSNVYDYTNNEIGLYCYLTNSRRHEFETGLNEAGFEVKQELVWNKGMILGRSDYHWSHEPCLYGKKKKYSKPWYGDRKQKTILTNHFDPTKLSKEKLVELIQELQRGSTNWEIRRDAAIFYIHPTQKPIDLAGRAIQNSSQEGEIVIDMFSGSGSTLLATHKLNRQFRGMELDPKYAQLIKNRVEIYDTDIKVEVKHYEV